MQTKDLIGPALNWAVAVCEGYEYMKDRAILGLDSPSTDWSQGGPIIEREGLCLTFDPFVSRWTCATPVWDSYMGDTALLAAMRCYVASKLGCEVDIPEELMS